MTLGIAMCTYNGEKYIQEQLTSILNQTLKPDKMIICDDGSSDNTVNILKNFASYASFDVEIVVNKENLGSTKNFEKAIYLCDTDIIALSDQDDVWLPEKLQKIQETFAANPDCAYVFTDAQIVDEKLQSLGCTMWETIEFTENKRKLFKQGYDKEILIKSRVVTGATMAFRRNIKSLISPIAPAFVHDVWIALILTLKGKKGIFIDSSTILYRQHTEQQIGAINIGRQRATMTAEKTQELVYRSNFIKIEMRKAGFEHEFANALDYRYIDDLRVLLRECYRNPQHYKSAEELKKAESLLKERLDKVSFKRIFFNPYCNISFKIKVVQLKLGIYKFGKRISRIFG